MKTNNFLVIVILFVSFSVKAQNNAQVFAGKVADRMKDSLHLSTQQRNTIYSVSIQLADRKLAVRQQFQQVDSIRYHMQRVENTRDSLYRNVLDEQQYLLYKSKKMILLNN